MKGIIFTSVLGAEYLAPLEKLMFLNPNQHQVRAAIVGVVERYGAPRIANENGKLRIRVAGLEDVQSLFALDRHTFRRLLGAMVYSRTGAETLSLLHLAVVDDYAAEGSQAAALLVMRLISKLREIAHQIRGVRVISVYYGGGEPWAIPVA